MIRIQASSSIKALTLVSGLLSATFGMTGCDVGSGLDDQTAKDGRDRYQRAQGLGYKKENDSGSIFGPGGLFGSRDEKKKGLEEPGVAVNAYLWRASLDTLNFMPLASADPFGGVIITDWYSPSESPNERLKVSVLILDRELRADGIRATVFRQQMSGARGWVEAPVDPKTGRELEDTILTRARQLRVAQYGN